MTITLGSIFRDSATYVDRFFSQIAALERDLGESIRLVIAEGDSTDETYELLAKGLIDRHGDDELLKVDHGGPKFGSIDHPQRWYQIALVDNAVMDAATELLDGPMIYVESDLIWEPGVMAQLLEDLAAYPAVAPLSLKDGRFYDTYGHRGLDGKQFESLEPFHEVMVRMDPVVEIGSAGSCVVMREDVAAVARFGENDCIVGLGRNIRERAGASLWLDKRVAVHHP
jgi:hypothetical protein